MVRTALLGLLASGCSSSPYLEGGIVRSGHVRADDLRRFECLDLGLSLIPPKRPPPARIDAERAARLPLLGVHFGNRCGDPALLDLSKLTVTGRDDEGALRRIEISDPGRALRPLHVDAWTGASETLRLLDGEQSELAALCVELAGVAEGPTPRPVCFGTRELRGLRP